MNRTALSQSAFTLLEMLVALGIMAVLAGGLYASLSVGFHARERAEAALSPVRIADTALDLVARDLNNALPPLGILAAPLEGVDGLADSGDPDTDRIIFYALTANDGEQAARIRGIEFALTSDELESDFRLVRRVTDNLLAPVAETPKDEIICRRVTAFNIQYFDGAEWSDDWNAMGRGNVLPDLVEIALTIRKSDEEDADTFTLTRTITLPCGGVGPAEPPSGGGDSGGSAGSGQGGGR